METFRWVGSSHPQSLASGRMLAPGETVELSAEEARDPQNAVLIEEGGLIPVKAPKKQKGVEGE